VDAGFFMRWQVPFLCGGELSLLETEQRKARKSLCHSEEAGFGFCNS